MAIAGDGPDRAELEQQAVTLGIQGNVEFLGQRSDVPELMGRAKLYALTSRWEGVSIAMLEAMAVKTVPVVSDVGDLRDFAIDGLTGFVFAEENLSGYAETIAKLLQDESLRERMGACAHELILERAERTRLSRRWCDIFKELLVC